MGYSRNYLKYFEERKRERDEEELVVAAHDRDGGTRDLNSSMQHTDQSTNIDEHHHPSDDYIDSGSSSSAEQEALPSSMIAEDKITEVEEQDEDDGEEESSYPCVGNHDSSSIASSHSDAASNVYQLPEEDILGGNHSAKTSASIGECCSFEVMRLLDKAGSPRYLYNELMALLNKQSKKGLEISQIMSREALMKRLCDRFKYPKVQERKVSGYDVYKFPFVCMLQDLLDNCGSDMHTIDKEQSVNDNSVERKSELWNSSWMADTFRHCDSYKNFDSNKDIMLPLILYMDKTGTDALQRYSLEPVLFTTAAIPRETRESSGSWRHLGFVPPPLSKSDDTDDVNQLQLYHDFLSVLLEDLILAQKNPPVVTIQRNGERVQRFARLPVMIVMGDQKSQDTLCARKQANSGGAGRIHRSCMCSYVQADDPNHKCIDVCSQTLKKLTKSALMSPGHITQLASNFSRNNKEKLVIEKYLKRQQRMNSQILQYPFTQHAIRNAFDEVDFGSWKSGIFTATFDDFMHSTESGLFEYTAQLVYDGLTPTENRDLETAVRSIFGSVRSSVRSTYPRWRIAENFHKQTRMTCGEKVGSILVLALSLQYKDVAAIIHTGHARQRTKYLTFWSAECTDKKNEECTAQDHTDDSPSPPLKKSKVRHMDRDDEIKEKKVTPNLKLPSSGRSTCRLNLRQRQSSSDWLPWHDTALTSMSSNCLTSSNFIP